MKASKVKNLVKTLEALDRSLSWYKEDGSIDIETGEDSIYVKMAFDNSYLVLSGMAEYNADIVDTYGNVATIQIDVK